MSAPTQMQPATPPSSTRRALLWAVVLVALVPPLFLLSPQGPDAFQKRNRVRNIHLPFGIGFGLNVDSGLFMRLAADPRMIFQPKNVRQSRPMFIFAAALVTKVLEPVLPEPTHLAHFKDPERVALILRLFPSYVAYIVLNFVCLVIAIVLFSRLPGLTRSPLDLIVLSSFLVSNDVVKAFYWSPHTVMFSVLSPIVCMTLCVSVLRRSELNGKEVAILALVVGILPLFYGSFLTLLPALLISLVLAPLLAGRMPASLKSHAGKLAAAVAAFFVPLLAWVGTVVAMTGRFYSEETAEGMFVWVWDAFRAGHGELARKLGEYLLVYMRLCLNVSWMPILLLFLVSVLGILFKAPLFGNRSDSQRTLVAAGITFVLYFVFFSLMGFYHGRLAWNIVPPILAVIGVVLGDVTRNVRGAKLVVVRLVLVVSAGSWLVYEVMKRGPYS